MNGFNSCITAVCILLLTLIEGEELRPKVGVPTVGFLMVCMFIVNFIPFLRSFM